MTTRSRRYFWGNSLAHAVMSAARHHGVDPERLAYQVHRKRHGFVKVPRVVVIEVDPSAPVGPGTERPPAIEARAERPIRTELQPAPVTDRSREAGNGAQPREARRRTAPRAAPRGQEGSEIWDAPDEDAVLAAAEAARRLLRLAGLELEVGVEILPDDRVEVKVSGPDEAEVMRRGLEFLEELEHLLPRAAHGLSGRMVRCRVECAGLRASHEQGLRELARAAAAAVLSEGAPRELEALPPGDRRIVHLVLQDLPGVETESYGSGVLKRVVIRPAGRAG